MFSSTQAQSAAVLKKSDGAARVGFGDATVEKRLKELGKIAIVFATEADALAGVNIAGETVTLQAGDRLTIEGRGASSWIVGNETANGANVITVANGLTASLVVKGLPLIASEWGILPQRGDNAAYMEVAEAYAANVKTTIQLDVKGTYRASHDVPLNLYEGVGWVQITGVNHDYYVNPLETRHTRPRLLENAHQAHAGGQGQYTAFVGGIAYQGVQIFMARNGAGHISAPTTVAKYIRSETGEITRGVLNGTDGNPLIFNDARDMNLAISREPTSSPILSFSELTTTPGVYTHHFYRLAAGTFDVVTAYDTSTIPSNEFMWGNAVQTPTGKWLKCTYYQSPDLSVRNVYLYRATVDGINPDGWIKVMDPLFTDGTECTLCFFEDKLVAITRARNQSDVMKLRWTYDLEGGSGWSEVSLLPFPGAAPAVLGYIPPGEPIFLHTSEQDASSGYRQPMYRFTYDLETWTPESTAQAKNYAGSGAYGALVPANDGDGYACVYYEEVGAVTGLTRLWLIDLPAVSRAYPNKKFLEHKYRKPDALTPATILPDGSAAIGTPADFHKILQSNGNGAFFEIEVKENFSINAVLLPMKAASDVSVTVAIMRDNTTVATTNAVTVGAGAVLLRTFTLAAPVTLQTGSVYRFTVQGAASVYGRTYRVDPRRAIRRDFGVYVYRGTTLGGNNFNTLVMAHGFKVSL